MTPAAHRFAPVQLAALAVVLTFAAVPAALAQTASGTEILLVGKVTNQADEPLRGVTLTFTRVEEPEWQRTTTSDRKGRYKLFLREGHHLLEALVEKEGHQSTKGILRPVRLASSEDSGAGLGSAEESRFEVDFRLRDTEPTPEELASGAVDEDIRIIAAQVAYNRGVKAARQGRYEEALEAFELTLLADPRHRSAPFSIGKLLFDQKDYPGAAEHFTRLAESPRASAELLELTYHALKNSGRLAEVDPILDRLWQTDPHRAHDELLELATYYRQRDEKPQARETIEKLLQTDPRNPTALYFYARLLQAMGEPELAIRHFHTFLEIAPDAREAEPVRRRLKALEAEAKERAASPL